MARRTRSQDELGRVARAFHASACLESLPVAAFCTGFLARAEAGEHVDLNVFVITNVEPRCLGSLTEYRLLTEIHDIQERLQLAPFRRDPLCLKVWFVDDLTRTAGAQRDDRESLFITRLRLLLESEPVLHAADYHRHLTAVAHYYCRGDRCDGSLNVGSLLNELLRYWRTICLNDQERRDEEKNGCRRTTVDLKFSQTVAIFGTVFAVVTELVNDADELVSLCRLPPIDRLAAALDRLNDAALTDAWPRVLDIYEESLTWTDDLDAVLPDTTIECVNSHAEGLSNFLYSALTHHRIRTDLRRYLVV
jgi:hypothetical protein